MTSQPISKPARYPQNIVAFTEKVDRFDVVFAEHVNSLQAEVVALERFLGVLSEYPTNVQSSSLGSYLADLQAAVALNTASVASVTANLTAFMTTVAQTYRTIASSYSQDDVDGLFAALDWQTDIDNSINYALQEYQKNVMGPLLGRVANLESRALGWDTAKTEAQKLSGIQKEITANQRLFDLHLASYHDDGTEMRFKKIILELAVNRQAGWEFERTLGFVRKFDRPGTAYAIAQTYGPNADEVQVWITHQGSKEFTLRGKALKALPAGRKVRVLIIGVANERLVHDLRGV